MDESASLLDPTTNLLPNSAIQQDPFEDHNLMGDEHASPSSTDLYNMIDFGPECPENQNVNWEDLLNDSTSQTLESEVTPSEMHNDPTSQSLNESLESEVHPSHPNSQSSAQFLKLEAHPSHPRSQSLESEVLPNNNTSQSLELQVLQDVSTSQSFPNVSYQQHLCSQQCQIAPTSPHCHQFIQVPPPSNKRQKTSSKQCKLEYESAMEKRNNDRIISAKPERPSLVYSRRKRQLDENKSV